MAWFFGSAATSTTPDGCILARNGSTVCRLDSVANPCDGIIVRLHEEDGKTIDNIPDDEIQNVAIPTGIPIVYKFDKNLQSIRSSNGSSSISSIGSTANGLGAPPVANLMHGVFLEKPGLLREALKRERQWAQNVPGYDSTMAHSPLQLTPMEKSLIKLQAERELGEWAGQFIDVDKNDDHGGDGKMGAPINIMAEDEVWEMALNKQAASEEGEEESKKFVTNNIISTSEPCVVPGMAIPNMEPRIRQDAVIVIIRHGKTEHNKLGLFTGWEDAPLARDGVVEAKEAGRLLKKHGFEFDVVYTSWLSRAIETAWWVMDELDCLWLPIIKSWRLNERMYGDLTGLSKRMVAQRHGEKQFKAWRRGYKVRPPPVTSFSPHYPGNDKRYRDLNDVRISIRESFIRSIESGRLNLHPKLPKSESLKDCMDRTIPYFTHQIVPEAINEGKRVLISSSENAIRGLLMHLCEIPEEQITKLEIPNGLPLIFDVKSKCVKLLDDGSGQDPLQKYNFGDAASYLFRPCTTDDGNVDEECDIRFMSDAFFESQGLNKEEQEALENIKRPVSTTASSSSRVDEDMQPLINHDKKMIATQVIRWNVDMS
eukprot:CAMPEP_0118687124 /NCGR_PEP_ID=MMETSP0800-20121206/8204_1 /TAXON_ID=210618 ORGANISM="Striatella unipunctata, Strain CCMP2910" /NCGR_SAMPLE_ID=MMETSP0800 /ASSEMBLY_ACC=CAM_ASM_000638 /LENGTH=596 /DNA_ID=CAMNT_0006584265 /DNA_START=18 /DNA_END=1809 /DNA_ORIENTATION=-